MNLFRVGVVLAVIGMATVGYGVWLFPDAPRATYYVDASPDSAAADDPTVRNLSAVDADVRDEVRRAIETGEMVEVGTESPRRPGRIAYEGEVYRTTVVVGDPGGGHVFARLGTLIAGFLLGVVGASVAVFYRLRAGPA